MAILTKEALLGASDLREREIELPSLGGSVRVRSLSAKYSNQAISDAIEMVNVRGEQIARFSQTKLEELQVLHGLVDPKLETVEEARVFSERVGPAWRQIVSAIDELSGIDKEAIQRANDTFPPGGQVKKGSSKSNGAAGGSGRPDLSARTGA